MMTCPSGQSCFNSLKVVRKVQSTSQSGMNFTIFITNFDSEHFLLLIINPYNCSLCRTPGQNTEFRWIVSVFRPVPTTANTTIVQRI